MRLLLILTCLTLHSSSHLLGSSDEKRLWNDIYRLRADPTELSKVFDESFYYFDCWHTTFDLPNFLMVFTDLYENVEFNVTVVDKFHFDMGTDLFKIRFVREETSEGLKIVSAKTSECTRKFYSITINRVLKNSMDRNNSKLLEDFSKNFHIMNCNGHMYRDEFIENFLYDPEFRIKGRVLMPTDFGINSRYMIFAGKDFTIDFEAERKPENPQEFMLVRAEESRCSYDLRTKRGMKVSARQLQTKLLEQEDTEELKKIIDPKFIFYDCGHYQHDRDEYLEKNMLKTTLSNGIVESAKMLNEKLIYLVQSGGSNYSNVAYIKEVEENQVKEKIFILFSSSKVNC